MSKKRTAVTTVAETKEAVTETVKTSWEDEVKMYIGPSFKGVTSRTIFKNGLTPELQSAVEKTPIIKLLIVPMSKLAKAQLELGDKASARATAYAVVSKQYV